MATKQFLGTRYQSFKNDGTVNSGGKVYFYEPGTSTSKTTYSNSALTSSNANPVILNAAGAADIWYDGDADVSVYDSTDVLVDSYPNINPATSSSTVESNFISNGSFEEGGSTTPSNWTRSTPPALGTSAQDLDSAHGLYSWKFTSGGNGAGNLITTSFFNVAVGRIFNVIWQMKSSVADVRNLVEVVWYDDASAEISASSLYDDSTTNPTSWTTKSALATPVANAVRAKLRITGCHSSDPTNGSTWFDGIIVSENPTMGSGQISFPSTQNSSSGANVLDDYEEGTWTPSVGGTATYNNRVGSYTKIGSVVTFHCYLDISAIGTGNTGTISGLPFTAKNVNFTYYPVSIGHWIGSATAFTSIIGHIALSTTTITLLGNAAASTTAGAGGAAVLGTGTVIYIGGSYITS